jgi:serine/threonine protein kinase
VEAYDMISKTLNFNPEKRPSMLDILKHPYLK